MKKCIYRKYSAERNRDKAISTSIMVDENGTRVARKKALYPEGADYIRNMPVIYEALTKRFEGCAEVAGCKLIQTEDDGVAADFEYVEGIPLSDLFNEYVRLGDKAGLKKAIEEYLPIVVYTKKETYFSVTDGFLEVFGEPSDKWLGQEAVDVADIDMVPANIIVREDKTKCIIDYEWTFLFAVPCEYIRFRSILFWYNESRGDTLFSWEELMRMLGVCGEDEIEFRRWEDHFQKYIAAERDTQNEVRIENVRSVEGMLKADVFAKSLEPVMVYYDCGDGFDERPSEYIKREYTSNGLVKGNITAPKEAGRVRFIVASHRFLLMITGFSVDGTPTVDFTFVDGQEVNDRIIIGTNSAGIDLNISGIGKDRNVEFEFYLISFENDDATNAAVSGMLQRSNENEKNRREAVAQAQMILTSGQQTGDRKWTAKSFIKRGLRKVKRLIK